MQMFCVFEGDTYLLKIFLSFPNHKGVLHLLREEGPLGLVIFWEAGILSSWEQGDLEFFPLSHLQVSRGVHIFFMHSQGGT